MIGPAFHRVQGTPCGTSAPCFPGAHSGLLDLLASLLANMQPEDCGSDLDHSKSRIATHLRHCIATYQAFLDGVAGRRIDYDMGSQVREYRTCRDVFDHVLLLHTRLVQEVAPLPPCTRLLVRHEESWMESSIARESAYLEQHTIHHCISVAIMMEEVPSELDRVCIKEFAENI